MMYIKKFKVLIMISLFIIVYAIFFHIPTIDAYIVAIQNDIHVDEIRFGPYYKITEGKGSDKEIKYIVKIYSSKQNYIFDQSEGISKSEALLIAQGKGYTNVKNEIELEISTNRSGKLDTREAVIKNLVWILYYDSSFSLYVEIDFETGELIDFPRFNESKG